MVILSDRTKTAIRDMRKGNATYAEICARFKLPVTEVMKHCKGILPVREVQRRGLAPHRAAMLADYEAGSYTLKEMAVRYGYANDMSVNTALCRARRLREQAEAAA